MFQNHPQTDNAGFSGKIGVAQKDITPPVEIYAKNWGAGNDGIKSGVHHPFTLTCLVFLSDVAKRPLVLIAADLGWWNDAADEQHFRLALLQAFALEEAELMVCFSHTHSGPSLFMENSNKPGGKWIPVYLEQLKEQALLAIREALASAVPATLSWKYGSCGLAANRDQPTEQPGEILVGFDPEKKADDTLLVGRITDGNGAIIATIVNYACHPTTLAWDNHLLSPDYIGAMRKLVEEHTKGACIFLQGASGDLAPAEQYSGNPALADRYGRCLGYAVLSVLEAMLPPETQLYFARIVESGATLGVWEQRAFDVPADLRAELQYIELLLKPLPTLKEIEQQWEACDDPVLKERLWRKRGIRKNLGDGGTAAVPLWIWRLGACCLIGQPNEAYSWFQQELRNALLPYPAAVMNIVNGHTGYLPPEKLYSSNIYAVWQTPFAPGSLEQLTSRAITAAHKIMQ